MKKIILLVAVTLLCSALVFAEMDLAGGTLEFENELTLTPVQNFKNHSSTTETYDYDGLRFGEIDNTTEIRLTTPFIDVYLKPSMYNI